jgi:hypothetical protein
LLFRNILAVSLGLIAAPADAGTGTGTGTDVAGAGSRSETCAPQNGIRFLCGIVNVEDMVSLPNSDWIIASGMSAPGRPQGHLYMVNSRSLAWFAIDPDQIPDHQDRVQFPGCPGPIDARSFSTHGLALRRDAKDRYTLFATSHGSREAIEVFELTLGKSEPQISWRGCVPHRGGVFLNSVAPLPDGGLIATSMFDPHVPGFAEKLARREIMGSVLEWHRETGWKEVPGGRIFTPNGVAVSGNGRSIYVTSWGDRRIYRLRRGGPPFRKISARIGFMPDNIHWTSDGKRLLIAGQKMTLAEANVCAFSPALRCTSPSTVVEMSPRSMWVRTLVQMDGDQTFGAATTALQVGNQYWLGSYRNDRVAIIPANQPRVGAR